MSTSENAFEGYLKSLAKDRDAVTVLVDQRPGMYGTNAVGTHLRAIGYTQAEARKVSLEVQDDKDAIRNALSDILDRLEHLRSVFRQAADRANG